MFRTLRTNHLFRKLLSKSQSSLFKYIMGKPHSKAGNAEDSNMKSNLSLSYFEYHDLSYYHIKMINVKSKILELITYLILFVIGSKYTSYSNPEVNTPAHLSPNCVKIKPTTPKEKENGRREKKKRMKAHLDPSKE